MLTENTMIVYLANLHDEQNSNLVRRQNCCNL